MGATVPGGGYQYDFATVQMTLDPTTTTWIAMQDYFQEPVTPGTYAYGSCPPVGCVGAHGFGTDDYIVLTITNPGGSTATVTMDQNDPFGNSFGPQMVIFGSAADAPDVRRYNFNTSTYYYINEAGAFNGTGIFSGAGVYTFDFSFRNQWSSSAGHNWMYLLADVAAIAEPESGLLFGLSLLGLFGLRIGARRRRDAR